MAGPSARAVLIVEDESVVARDLRRMLADLKYDPCALASTAEEAMASAAERRPDIALVDIRIKGKLDGIKTAQLLRESLGIPIVYLTAHADKAAVERAAQTRPHGYLLKPVKPAELKSTIERALARHLVGAGEHTPAPSPALAPHPAAPSRGPGVKAIRRQLEQILSNPDFDASRRSRDFLQYIVQETLAGRGEALSQGAIATRVFGRKDDFDALLDPIVRIQAGRLRRSLERYYLLAGRQDPVRIELPKGGYLPLFRTPDPSETAAPIQVDERAVHEVASDWPAVGVSLFETAATSPELKEIAVRLQEELANELGRYRDVRVVRRRDPSRHPGVRFALAGRIRVQDHGFRVTVRLIDHASDRQIWADEYQTDSRRQRWSGTPDDVARVMAARVGAENGAIVQALAGEYRSRPSAAAGAYGAILRSYDFLFTREIEDLVPAVEGLRRAVAEEPEIPLAWTQLARLYQVNYTFELSDLVTPLDKSISFAYQGVRLDSSSPRTRCVLASALLIKGEIQAGREELEQALRQNPGSLVYLEIIGYLMAFLGDWDRGIELIRSAIERNPHHQPHANYGLWAYHLRRGEFEEAYLAALQHRDATFFWRSLMRACCLGHLGRTAEAGFEVGELLRVKPGFPDRGRILIGHYIKPAELQERVAEGLRKAGLDLR